MKALTLLLLSLASLSACNGPAGPIDLVDTDPTDGLFDGYNPPVPTPDNPVIELGVGASFNGYRPFPASSPWNQDISQLPVDSYSDAWINSIGRDGKVHPDFGTVWNGQPIGHPYVVVSGSQPKVYPTFLYKTESDVGPYPIPDNVQIQAGSDKHIIIIDRDNLKLYEMFNVTKSGSAWHADSGAIFDMKTGADRPKGWTSSYASGLPGFPSLVRYDEVMVQKEIRHALAFSANMTQKGFIYPARHQAGSTTDPNVPPMGARLRLKASYDISWASPPAQVVLRALKRYGMFLLDNGTSWMIGGSPDSRWNDGQLGDLKKIPGSAFEVVKTGTVER